MPAADELKRGLSPDNPRKTTMSAKDDDYTNVTRPDSARGDEAARALGLRRHRRHAAPLRAAVRGAESRRELSRAARLDGQLRRQQAGDDAVPARGDGGADRPRLRARRAASRWSRSCTTSSACCTPTWRSTTPTSTARRYSSSARPARWTRPSAARSIDWIHTALVQGAAVRDYTKWDYQPTAVDGVPESFARAYWVMMSEPRGPGVHVLRRVAAGAAARPRRRRCRRRAPGGARRRSRQIRRRLRRPRTCWPRAKRPVILAEYVGRDPKGFRSAGRAGRNAGRAGVRRQLPPQLPEPAIR